MSSEAMVEVILERMCSLSDRLDAMEEDSDPQDVQYAYMLWGDGAVLPCRISDWLRWSVKNPKGWRIAQDVVGSSRVSTVFLGISTVRGDPNKEDENVFFETMVFGGYYADLQWRYHDKKAALDGHRQVVTMVRDAESEIARLMDRTDGHDRSGDLPRARV
jgi:hypothetical protein